MLSVKGISQGQDTKYYFEKDNNYYFKEDQEHLIAAFEWDGKGAASLGLKRGGSGYVCKWVIYNFKSSIGFAA